MFDGCSQLFAHTCQWHHGLRRIEKNGNRVMMKISAFTRNPKIRDTQLDLRVPVGTKVTYALR